MKVGIGLCLVGAICLILFGAMMVLSPSAAEQLNGYFERIWYTYHSLRAFDGYRISTNIAKKMNWGQAYEKVELFVHGARDCTI